MTIPADNIPTADSSVPLNQNVSEVSESISPV